MENMLKTRVRIEISELDESIDRFIMKYNLPEVAKIDLKCIAKSSVSTILHLIDPTEPFGSITKLEGFNKFENK